MIMMIEIYGTEKVQNLHESMQRTRKHSKYKFGKLEVTSAFSNEP